MNFNRILSNCCFPSALVFVIMLTTPCAIVAQQCDFAKTYSSAMTEYDKKGYDKSAELFRQFLQQRKRPSESQLYNGACVFALSGDSDKALELLNRVAAEHFYHNLNHVLSDPDLEAIRKLPEWGAFIARVKQNLTTKPERTRKNVAKELLKAKAILANDSGKLWGVPISINEVLVLDFDNTIYSLRELPGSERQDGLYFKKIPENQLSFTNSAQRYEGERRAVVLANYLDDQCETIIHEAFHVLQLKARKFRGDAVNYLDNEDARIWMRLEFEALRNALRAVKKKSRVDVVSFLCDAATFRKLRQTKYRECLEAELELETLEGIANYTGIKLSATQDKVQDAISEINGRESAATFTRPFPYATGPAYGLLFDQLGIDWKSGDMATVYNFLEIVERHVKNPLNTNDEVIDAAKQRNNFGAIEKEELARTKKHNDNIEYYTRLLLNQPTLRARVAGVDGSFRMSFDMNGTLVLGDKGVVYSHIKGTDIDGSNFGSFWSIAGKDSLGEAGILGREDGEFVFPFPIKMEDKRIIGDRYEIQLNDGWKVQKIAESEDLEIVKE